MAAQDAVNEMYTLVYLNGHLLNKVAQESTLLEVKQAVEGLVFDGDVVVKIEGVAKQGDNEEATNSAIYNLLGNVMSVVSNFGIATEEQIDELFK